SCRTSVAAPNIFKVESPSDNVHHTNSFFLPDDWDTEEFQHNLHFSLKKLFNGNVTPAVVPVLKKGAHVIQMGTCSGAWIMDMATHYPDCKFTAIELASEQIQVLPELPNITCERGDALERGFISAKDGSVDYIHLRSVGSLVKKHCWAKIFAEIHRVLKPDVKEIFNDMDQDPEIALKYGNMLQTEGFQVIESKKRRVHYGNDGKLSQEFVSAILNLYEQKSSLIAPRLGLDLEDYRHRIEQICSECVKVDAYLEWYSWVGKKQQS
ncbi:S-adenosyl-L-methionine-dependent methyltransferase, partial [Mucor lusitanicus]